MANLVGNLVDHCFEPKQALETLNAQDWDDDIWQPTDEQLKEINRSLKEIDGEPSTEQIEAAFRSVM